VACHGDWGSMGCMAVHGEGCFLTGCLAQCFALSCQLKPLNLLKLTACCCCCTCRSYCAHTGSRGSAVLSLAGIGFIVLVMLISR
jgi:hypothetical protein